MWLESTARELWERRERWSGYLPSWGTSNIHSPSLPGWAGEAAGTSPAGMQGQKQRVVPHRGWAPLHSSQSGESKALGMGGGGRTSPLLPGPRPSRTAAEWAAGPDPSDTLTDKKSLTGVTGTELGANLTEERTHSQALAQGQAIQAQKQLFYI